MYMPATHADQVAAVIDAARPHTHGLPGPAG